MSLFEPIGMAITALGALLVGFAVSVSIAFQVAILYERATNRRASDRGFAVFMLAFGAVWMLLGGLVWWLA